MCGKPGSSRGAKEVIAIHTETVKFEIKRYIALPPEWAGPLGQLEEVCRRLEPFRQGVAPETALSAQPGMDHLFLAVRDGALVGALGLFDPDAGCAEATALVHPEFRRRGLFSALWRAARAAIAPFGIKEVLFCHEPVCASGQGVADRWKLPLRQTELTLEHRGVIPAPACPVVLAPARLEELEALAVLSGAAFGDTPAQARHMAQAFLDDPDSGFYAARLEGVLVGQIVLRRQPEGLCLCALCVDPALQGRGIGRSVLTQALALAQESCASIFLDVSVENENALHLYTDVGFHTVACCRYYAMAL